VQNPARYPVIEELRFGECAAPGIGEDVERVVRLATILGPQPGELATRQAFEDQVSGRLASEVGSVRIVARRLEVRIEGNRGGFRLCAHLSSPRARMRTLAAGVVRTLRPPPA